MNKKVIIVFVLFILIFTGCKTKKTDNVISTELKTYNNEKYGLSFQYPANWNLYDSAEITISPENEKTLMNKAGMAGLSITPISPKKVQPEQESAETRKLADSWIKITNNINKDVGVDFTENEIQINSKNIIKVQFNNIKMQAPSAPLNTTDYVLGNSVMFFFIHQGQRFRMSYAYSIKDKDKYNVLLEQVTSSLKFIN